MLLAGWQKLAGFRQTQKMPSILLSAEYLLIGDKKCRFCAYHQNCNKSVVFAGNCKYLETLFLIFLKAQTRSFLHFLLLCIESEQKEAVMPLKLNKKLYKTRKSRQILILPQNIFFRVQTFRRTPFARSCNFCHTHWCRVEICCDRHDRWSCNICASCVNFPGKQHDFSHNLPRTTRFTNT